MADIYGAFVQGRQNGEARRTKRTLSQHLQGALGGDQAALTQIYQADPNAGMSAQKLARDNQNDSLEDVAKAAQFFEQTRDPKAYAYMHQRLSSMPQFAGLPATIDTPEDQEGAVKFAQAIAQTYGEVGKGNELPADIRTLQMLQANPELMELDKQRRQAGWKPSLYQTNEGYSAFIPQTQTGVPVYEGQPQQPAQQSQQPMQQDYGPAETDNYVRKIMGNVGAIDPNMPPEQQAELILPHLIQQESAGNPNAVSPKGARGYTQIMPATGKDPGFGVTPLRDNSPQENVRFGRDYLTAMLKRYPGRPDLALAAYNAGHGVADRVAGANARRSQPVAKTQAQSEIEKRIELARSMGASPDELRQMVVGRDGAAAGAKPMPVAAINMIKEETNAANSAQAITTSIEKHLGRIQRGELQFGPVANLINKGRNAAGQSNAQSRNYQEFESDLEKLRNDSLRLNSGVQTDGDAQRAWNELFANLNDAEYVKQRLQTINELNKRAEGLRRMNIDMIRENYGKGGEPAPAAPPAGGGWKIRVKN